MSEWITDRLPNESDIDVDGDVLTPWLEESQSLRTIDWSQAVTIRLGDPWMPAPPPYVPPKTREEFVQELLDAIDCDSDLGKFATWRLKVLEAREALR